MSALFRRFVGVKWQDYPDHENVISVESRIDLSQVNKTLDKQSRTREQNKRERDFGYDEQTSDAITSAGLTTMPPTVFEHLVEVGTRSLQRRDESKEKTRKKLSLPADYFGSQYCYVGLERTSKIVLAWHLGTREYGTGEVFVQKLAHARSIFGRT